MNLSNSETLNSGYLIVLDPTLAVRQYENMWAARGAEPVAYLSKLRSAFKPLDPASYRGCSRDPLYPLLPADDGSVPEAPVPGRGDEDDWHARRRLVELDPLDSDDPWDLIPTLDIAREVYALLDVPSRYEIIHVRRTGYDARSETLGFDVGWWGGEWYSLIADCAITPTWHLPDPADFAEVATQLRTLNQHLLFDSARAASEFINYYRSKPWAEHEGPAAFSIIQVDQVSR